MKKSGWFLGVLDAGVLAQASGPVDEHLGLLGGRHVDRVDLVLGDPGDVVVRRLGRELDRISRLLGH